MKKNRREWWERLDFELDIEDFEVDWTQLDPQTQPYKSKLFNAIGNEEVPDIQLWEPSPSIEYVIINHMANVSAMIKNRLMYFSIDIAIELQDKKSNQFSYYIHDSKIKKLVAFDVMKAYDICLRVNNSPFTLQHIHTLPQDFLQPYVNRYLDEMGGGGSFFYIPYICNKQIYD